MDVLNIHFLPLYPNIKNIITCNAYYAPRIRNCPRRPDSQSNILDVLPRVVWIHLRAVLHTKSASEETSLLYSEPERSGTPVKAELTDYDIIIFIDRSKMSCAVDAEVYEGLTFLALLVSS